MATTKGKSTLLSSILQWNVSGLRTRLSDLKVPVSESYPDILALQENNSLPESVEFQNILNITARHLVQIDVQKRCFAYEEH